MLSRTLGNTTWAVLSNKEVIGNFENDEIR